MAILSTDRLTLTPMAVEDYEDLRALWGDAAFATALFPAALSAEEVWLRLLRDIGHWSALGYGNWALRETATGAFVGSVGLFAFRRDLGPRFDAPELGWGVAPRFQGRGLAREAVAAAHDWARDGLNARRTVCLIADVNARSRRLAATMGYRDYARTEYRGAPMRLYERIVP